MTYCIIINFCVIQKWCSLWRCPHIAMPVRLQILCIPYPWLICESEYMHVTCTDSKLTVIYPSEYILLEEGRKEQSIVELIESLWCK